MLTIEDRVKALGNADRTEAIKTIGLFLTELEKGSVRAASRDEDGVWNVHPWVKEGILAAFRCGVLSEFASGSLSFIDKDTIPARNPSGRRSALQRHEVALGQIFGVGPNAPIIPRLRPRRGRWCDGQDVFGGFAGVLTRRRRRLPH